MLRSRWFPLSLAIAQSVRHVTLIAYGYWDASVTLRNFAIEEHIRRDLARPLFEPYYFCDAWNNYNTAHAANVSIDLPSYLAAMSFHSFVAKEFRCVDVLTTPRGQIITIPFIPIAWFLIGLSARRLATRRWRPEAKRRLPRAIAICGFLFLPMGVLLLMHGVTQAVALNGWGALRMFAAASWVFYLYVLAAERLRVWPFKDIEARIPVQDSRLD